MKNTVRREMYYEEYGVSTRPTIVLLHCAAIVEMYHKIYPDLLEKYHIIIPHLLGSGKEVQINFNFDECKIKLVQLINSLKKNKVYLLGHSEGANLAVALITSYPELFEKALISSPMIDATDKIAQRKARFVGLFYPIIKSRIIEKVYINFLKLKDKEQVQSFKGYWSKISKQTWSNYYSDRLVYEKIIEYPSVSVPIRYIYGSKEPKVIQETIEKLHLLNKNTEVKVIQGYGHEHPLKNNIIFTNHILEWFC